MLTIHKTIHLDSPTRMVKFRNMTDIHVGDSSVDYIKLYKDIQDIKADPYYFFGLGGDLIEAFNRSDKRYDSEHEAKFCNGHQDIVSAQIDYLVSELDGSESQLIYMLSGNHESKLLIRDSRDVMRDFCRAFPNVPYLGVTGYVILDFVYDGKLLNTVKIMTHHGTSTTQTKSGSATALEKQFLFNPNVDLILMGHSHCRQYIEHVSIIPYKDTAKKVSRYAAFCGTYKDGYRESNIIERDWAVSKGFYPVNAKSYLIEIYPDSNAIRLIEDL